ncbi:hypothetical protein ACVXAM_003840 [Vibrio parahaemolyticus]|nr:hypothetical protein [Vibrio alginolyticus]
MSWLSRLFGKLRFSKVAASISNISAGGEIRINGKVYKGNSISIDNDGRVFVDGKLQEDIKSVNINIHINGDVGDIDAGSGSVQCNEAKSINTGSGNVKCGDVHGDVRTGSGDVVCGRVRGRVTTSSGDVSQRICV